MCCQNRSVHERCRRKRIYSVAGGQTLIRESDQPLDPQLWQRHGLEALHSIHESRVDVLESGLGSETES